MQLVLELLVGESGASARAVRLSCGRHCRLQKRPDGCDSYAAADLGCIAWGCDDEASGGADFEDIRASDMAANSAQVASSSAMMRSAKARVLGSKGELMATGATGIVGSDTKTVVY